jgi:sirohydrochlorin ferrochelatase
VRVPPPPRLLIAAHGTESAAGSATTAALAAAVAAAAPDVPVGLCFLDVVGPSLADALDSADAADGPVVVVPLLLSTGYHVQTDIPAVAAGRAGVRVAGHLGPDPLVIDALAARLAEAGADDAGADDAGPDDAGPNGVRSTVLVGVGSSRPEARPELETAARLLGSRLGRPVVAMTLFEDVRAVLEARPAQVATYLLAEGEFHTRLRAAAAGLATVAAPLGTHPALVRLVLARYRSALTQSPAPDVR